ncbi:hypothetical protein [Cryobacterium sp. N19]|uniref:hypothetical protein n=1 Tax=Cryobacterium sp. N19 TaxID=2048288 RepID=UPI001124D118|nr:hypothetical protein [Cryobacterium sp. N19]
MQFTTIWPGWYRDRTVHIHLKVHVNKATVLTAQVGFDDDRNGVSGLHQPRCRRGLKHPFAKV